VPATANAQHEAGAPITSEALGTSIAAKSGPAGSNRHAPDFTLLDRRSSGGSGAVRNSFSDQTTIGRGMVAHFVKYRL